jgi:3-oxoadipate enol-lactonase
VAGRGPDVVFIHGEDHGIELFDDQIPFFAERYRCITYYRRGHGKSQLAPYGYSLHNQTLDLACLLDHLSVQSAAIIAVAMATPIAVEFTIAQSARVKGLVLVSWYELDGYPLMEERRKSKHPMTFGRFHMLEYEVMRDRGPQGLCDLFHKEGDALIPILPQRPDLRERVARMIASHQPEHFVKAAEYYTSLHHLTPRLKELDCPIIGICGSEDPSPDNPDLLAGAKNFRQVWIPGARRFSMIESPHEFNAAVDEFLQHCR